MPTPYVLALPNWTDRQIRTYMALGHHCRGRLEHRITAGELARTAGLSPGTVNRALRELVAARVLYSPDGEREPEGRRWRFAWSDYEPPTVVAVTPARGPGRKRRPNTRRGGARGTCDPGIVCASAPLEIPGSQDLRSGDHKPPLPDPPDPKYNPPSDQLGDARPAWRDGLLLKLVAWAHRFDLGTYSIGDAARWLSKAELALELELGVCPLPGEWLAFAQETWGGRTVALGAGCPLAVALGPRRVVPWFRRRYAPRSPPEAKPVSEAPRRRRRGGPTDGPTPADLEAFTERLRRGDV